MVKVIFDKVLGVVREDIWLDYLKNDGFDYDFDFAIESGGQIYYLGDETTDGSWRLISLGDGNFTTQKRVLGTWTTKQFNDDTGLNVVGSVEAYGNRDLLRYNFMLG